MTILTCVTVDNRGKGIRGSIVKSNRLSVSDGGLSLTVACF